MPLYETIAVAEKYSVILDIGNAYTKVGFARECGPRFIIPTEVIHPHTGQVTKIWNYHKDVDLYILLKEFIHRLYFKYLVVNPKDRRVVIVESILCPVSFRDTLAKVLFKHFEIPSLLFVPSHLMALFTLGIPSALVLDAGYCETIALPIYEDVPILGACQILSVGGQAIHRRIEAELMDKAVVKTSHPEEKPLGSVLMEPLKETVLEDIKVRSCFVTPRGRGHLLQVFEANKNLKGVVPQEPEAVELPPAPADVSYPLDGGKVMTVPGRLREWAPEVLFEQNADEQSLATLILDALLKCPIDTRKVLAENIIIMGGTAMLPGFKHSLLEEVKSLLQDPRYCSRLPLKEIKVHSPPAKENYVAWLGAATFGATEAVASRSLTKDQYQQKLCIPDWSDQKWQENSGKSLI